MLRFAERGLRLISEGACVLATVALALLVLLLVTSIMARMVGISVPSVDDISGILLAAVFALGMAASVGYGGHLSITLLVERFPPGPQFFLSRLAEVITVAVGAYLFVGISKLTLAAIRTHQEMLGQLPIPTSVPMMMIVLGLGLFTLACAGQLIQNLFGRGALPSDEDA